MSAPIFQIGANENTKAKRVRASESALRIALKVTRESGLAVEKLCISGGQFEIHVRPVEDAPEPENHEGLKEW